MSEPTNKPTPGQVCIETDVTGVMRLVQSGGTELITGPVANQHGPIENKLNARLLAASWNSYQANCADPVKAAEKDLLGRALDLLRDIDQDDTDDPGTVLASYAKHARQIRAIAASKKPTHD